MYCCFCKDISWDEFINTSHNSVWSEKVKLNGSHNINDSDIGDYTYIGKNANIFFTSIGKYCSIGPNFTCGWGIHPTIGISTSPMFYSTKRQNGISVTKCDKIEEQKRIIIGNDVFIGINVTILDGVTVGDGAIIGAGTVVSKDIPPYAIAVGSPIQIIKYRFDKNTIDKLLKIEWWNMDDDNIHKDIEHFFFEIEEFIHKMETNKTMGNKNEE